MPTPIVNVNPKLLRWAIARSRIPEQTIQARFPRLAEWLRNAASPTLRQLEDFARFTMTPLGYLLLAEPPEERLPIPDFRTKGDTPIDRPSPNLLETIQAMQQRQAWMREHLLEASQDPLPFVARAARRPAVEGVADDIRRTLGLGGRWAADFARWEDALQHLRDAIDGCGILVAMNGVVGNNTHRPLDPEEFRGFVLVDEYAPLVFVNTADFKAAQMFTLAHELAQVWLGKSALFNLIHMLPEEGQTDEAYCNRVAAELLVPRELFLRLWQQVRHQPRPFDAIARSCKVSGLVAARRALDLRVINRREFFEFYASEVQQLAARRQQQTRRSGGDFYRTAHIRIGRRFGEAVARAVAEGQLLYRDAYRLTGLKAGTFERYVKAACAPGEVCAVSQKGTFALSLPTERCHPARPTGHRGDL